MINNKDLASLLINLVGGKENIVFVFNCYTRARVNVKDVSKANIDAIKSTEGVIGVVVDKTQVQIIVGPGKAVKVAQEMLKQVEASPEANKNAKEIENNVDDYLKTKSEVRKKTNKGATALIRKISGIFVPIIPMFIACGLLLGIYTICDQQIKGFSSTPFGTVFNVLSSSVFTVLNVVVAYNACKEFGGDAIIGAALAGALTNPLMNGGLDKEGQPIGIWMGFYSFKAVEVGIFTILLVSIGTAYLEKLIRKFMPEILDAFMTPLITVIVMFAAALFLLQPFGAGLNYGLAFVFGKISQYCPWLLGIVPMFYLFLVLTGTHHSLMAVSLALIGPNKTGWTYVLAAQLMAGAAEVGAAIYIMLKTKNSKLKKTITGALPIGILGIDEPLIWGMSVPLKRPFISAGLGGLVGGTFVACMRVGAQVPEATGLQAALVFNKPGMFAIGFVMAMVAGFLIQILVGFKDPVELTDEVLGITKEQYIETSYALKLYNKYREKHPKKLKAGGENK